MRIQRHHSKEICSWPRALRRWLAGERQIIKTVFGKLQNTFGLRREQPYALSGFAARLATRMSLHNSCIWLDRQLGRPNLTLAGLADP